ISLRSERSPAKRTTTRPPGSTPTTTPSPNWACTTSSPSANEPPPPPVAALDRAHVREHAVLEPDDEDDPELETLGVVERHQRDDALVVAQVVLLGEERELLEELLHRAAVLSGRVVLAR